MLLLQNDFTVHYVERAHTGNEIIALNYWYLRCSGRAREIERGNGINCGKGWDSKSQGLEHPETGDFEWGVKCENLRVWKVDIAGSGSRSNFPLTIHNLKASTVFDFDFSFQSLAWSLRKSMHATCSLHRSRHFQV